MAALSSMPGPISSLMNAVNALLQGHRSIDWTERGQLIDEG
jgi:hypothetical protein